MEEPAQAPVDDPEVADSAQATAACASSLGYVTLQTPPAVGVTPRENAAEGPLPPGVEFEVVAATRPGEGWIVVHGELRNTSDVPREVSLTEAGVGWFSATLIGPGLVRRESPPVPPRPALFPQARGFSLAAGARWPMEVAVIPSCWEDTRGAQSIHWWLGVAGDDVQGDVPVPR